MKIIFYSVDFALKLKALYFQQGAAGAPE